MSRLLLLHLTLGGLWLGCLLTEVAFERALVGRNHALVLARLHRRVDLWVEAPAVLGMLLSGAVLLRGAAPGPWLWAKVGAGLLAALANAVCVVVVLRRCAAAEAGRWGDFDRADHLQHRLGAVVAVGLLAALVLGGARA